MSKPQKVLTIVLWVAAVVSMVGVLALKTWPGDSTGGPASESYQPAGNDLPVMYDAPRFLLTDQNNNKVGNDQLAGHPWIADFVFTTCTTACPKMSAYMEQLQKELPAEVKLVSFSVDPEHDTPAAMAEYLKGYHAEPGRWIMLTGDLKTQTEVVAGMKLHFAQADKENAIQHDSRFVLVDGAGHVRGYYHSDDPNDMVRLRRDAGILVGHAAGGK